MKARPAPTKRPPSRLRALPISYPLPLSFAVSRSKRGQNRVIWGSFWGRFGVVSGSFWGRFGVVLGSFWGRFGVGLLSCYCRGRNPNPRPGHHFPSTPPQKERFFPPFLPSPPQFDDPIAQREPPCPASTGTRQVPLVARGTSTVLDSSPSQPRCPDNRIAPRSRYAIAKEHLPRTKGGRAATTTVISITMAWSTPTTIS